MQVSSFWPALFVLSAGQPVYNPTQPVEFLPKLNPFQILKLYLKLKFFFLVRIFKIKLEVKKAQDMLDSFHIK